MWFDIYFNVYFVVVLCFSHSCSCIKMFRTIIDGLNDCSTAMSIASHFNNNNLLDS